MILQNLSNRNTLSQTVFSQENYIYVEKIELFTPMQCFNKGDDINRVMHDFMSHSQIYLGLTNEFSQCLLP